MKTPSFPDTEMVDFGSLVGHSRVREGAVDVTKPYEFIGFGAVDVTKPCKFMGYLGGFRGVCFWAVSV